MKKRYEENNSHRPHGVYLRTNDIFPISDPINLWVNINMTKKSQVKLKKAIRKLMNLW